MVTRPFYSEFYPKAGNAGVRGTTTPALTEDRVNEIIGDIDIAIEDKILTRDEKIRILIPTDQELKTMYDSLKIQAADLTISTTLVDAAYTAWVTYRDSLVPAWNDTTQNTEIVRDTFREKINTYIQELTNLQKAITLEAARRADVDGGLTDNGTPIVREDVITEEGIAAGIEGQGSGATANDLESLNPGDWQQLQDATDKSNSAWERAGLSQGTQFPLTADDGDTFYRTDQKVLYIWNAATNNWENILQSINNIDNFSPDIRPMERVPSLPTTGNFDGRLVYLTTENQMYTYNGVTNEWDKPGLTEVGPGDFAEGFQPTGVGATLPTLPNTNWPNGAIFVNTTDGKTYTNKNGTWSASIDASDIDGSVPGGVPTGPTNPTTGMQLGDVFYNTTEKKLYTYNGAAWVTGVDAADVTGQIIAAQLAANSVTPSKLFIGDTSNMVLDSAMTDRAYWQMASNTIMEPAAQNATSRNRLVVPANAAEVNIYTAWIPAEELKDYFFSGGIQVIGTPDGASTGYMYLQSGILDVGGIHNSTAIGNHTTETRLTYGAIYSVPAGRNVVRIRFRRVAGGSNALAFDSPILRKAASGELIVDGSIVSDKLAANSVVAGKLAVDSVLADNIKSGEVRTNHLGANTVTASKLYIGDTSNMFPDSNLVDPDAWNDTINSGYGTRWNLLPVGVEGPSSTNYLRINSQAANSDVASPMIPLEQGTPYFYSFGYRFTSTANAGCDVFFRYYKVIGGVATYYDSTTVHSSPNPGSNVRTTISGQVTTPAGVTGLQIMVRRRGNTGVGVLTFESPIIRRASSGELIVDGSIITSKLAASSVVTDKLAAGSVTVNKLKVIPTGLVPDPFFSDIGPSGSLESSQFYWAVVQANGWYYEDRSAGNYSDIMGVPSSIILWAGHPTLNPGTNVRYVHTKWMSAKAQAGQSVRIRATCKNDTNQNIYATVQLGNSLTGAVVNLTGVTFGVNSGLQRLTAISTVPAGFDIWRMLVNNNGGPALTGAVGISDFQVDLASDATLIVDGSIIASKLSAGSVITDKLAAGAVVADKMASNSITARMLTLADLSNLVPNGDMNSTDNSGLWIYENITEANLTIVSAANAYTGSNYMRLTKASTSISARFRTMTDRLIPVIPGDQFYGEITVRTPASGGSAVGCYYRVIFYNSAGGIVSSPDFATNRAIPEAWTTYSGTVTVPANAVSMAIYPFSHSTATVTEMWIGQLVLRKKNAANLIVDGSIVSNHLAAGSVVANKISVVNLAAINANLGAITAGSLNINNRFIVAADGSTTIRSGTSGQRVEIDQNGGRVYDASNRLRVRWGMW